VKVSVISLFRKCFRHYQYDVQGEPLSLGWLRWIFISEILSCKHRQCICLMVVVQGCSEVQPLKAALRVAKSISRAMQK